MVPLLTPWPKAGRVGMWLLAFLCFLLGLIFTGAFAGAVAQNKPDQEVLLIFAVVFYVGVVYFVGLARLQAWLAGDRVIKQGPFWRSTLDLRRVRFALTVMKWQYTTQLSSGAVRHIEIESPALIIRSSWWRRIKIPLVLREGHQVAGETVTIAWLPLALREALATAIEEHAGDPRKAKVARFLRHVERSPVRPEGSAAPSACRDSGRPHGSHVLPDLPA